MNYHYFSHSNRLVEISEGQETLRKTLPDNETALREYDLLKSQSIDVSVDENIIYMPYLGQTIDKIWGGLSYKEKDIIVDKIIDILFSLDKSPQHVPQFIAKNEIFSRFSSRGMYDKNDSEFVELIDYANLVDWSLLSGDIVTHQDVHVGNIVIDDKLIPYVIDWETAVLSSPLLSLGRWSISQGEKSQNIYDRLTYCYQQRYRNYSSPYFPDDDIIHIASNYKALLVSSYNYSRYGYNAFISSVENYKSMGLLQQ